MTPEELSAMTNTELEELDNRLGEERRSRRCPDFLPGDRGCDKGNTPHDVHGFDRYDHTGDQIRVTWKKKED